MDETTLSDKQAAPSLNADSHATGPDLTLLNCTLTPDDTEQDKVGDPKHPENNPLRFQVRAQLGQGGMGAVFRVHDHDLSRDVAFKTMHLNPSPAVKNRFIRECRITGQLEHPNIVPLHDIGNDAQGHLYLSMRLVQGETLGALIERLRQGDAQTHKEYSYIRRLEIFLKILAAMDLAHSRGIIHRDLKPDNIMLGTFDEVFVMDWGLAGPFGTHAPPFDARQTQEGSVLGTPKFMSPEQATGQALTLDPRSDIYSLCAILYEFVTLQHYLGLGPEVTDILTILAAVMSTPPKAPEFVRHPQQDRVSRWLSITILKGLKKKPEERFANVKELMDEIRLFLGGKRTPVCPHTTMQRGLHELVIVMDNHPVITPAIAIGLCSILGLGFYALAKLILGPCL